MFEDEYSPEYLDNLDGGFIEHNEGEEDTYDLDCFPKEQQQIAVAKTKFILNIRKKLKDKGWTKENVMPIVDALYDASLPFKSPSLSSVQRWHRSLSQNQDNPAVLVSKHHRKGNRNSKVGDDKYFDLALERFLKATRPTAMSAYRYYESQMLIDIENGKYEGRPISQTAFYKRLAKLSSYEVTAKRYGKYKADMKFGYKGGPLKLERPLQRVEIDHTPLDLILLDDETLHPLGRPYLTILKDSLSKCIIGYHLSFQAPSYASASKAICHAMLPKKIKGPDGKPSWECHGKIETLVADNGAEFWSESLEHFCLEAGINIQYNKVGQPWGKGLVERNFLTIQQLILDDLEGKTFSNNVERADYNSVKNAKFKFSRFVKAFETWVAEVFNWEPNQKKTHVPMLEWRKAVNKFPPNELTPPEYEHIKLISGILKKPALQNNGIIFEHLRYDSKELADYRKQFCRDKKIKVTTKVNIDDLGFAYVYLFEYERYLKVPCVDFQYASGLSYEKHKVHITYIRKYNKIHGKSGLDQARAKQHIAEILEDIDASAKESSSKQKKVGGMKKAARVKGVDSVSVQTRREKDSNPVKQPSSLADLEMIWQEDT